MALGSLAATEYKTKKEIKKEKKNEKEKALTPEFIAIDRCSHPVCSKCRKHASFCGMRPTPEGYCTSLEEGAAWDHSCTGEMEDD